MIKGEGFARSRKKSAAIPMDDPNLHYAICHTEVENRFNVDQAGPLLDSGYEFVGENASMVVLSIPKEEFARREKACQDEANARLRHPNAADLGGEVKNKTDKITGREVNVSELFDETTNSQDA